MSFFGNLKRDAIGTVKGLNPANLVSAITHPDRTIANMIDFYGQLGRHPIRSFENAPISSALGIAPVVGPAARLARLKVAGSIPPADAAFADVMQAPRTSWSLHSENGFGVSLPDVPSSSILDAIGRGSDISRDYVNFATTTNFNKLSYPREGPYAALEGAMEQMDLRSPHLFPETPEDVFDIANTADYINPDAPDLGLLMNNHLKATQDMGIPDYALGDVPEASGLDYAHLEPSDFVALGMDTPIPPELDQFIRPYRLGQEALPRYTNDYNAPTSNLPNTTHPQFGPQVRGLQQDLLRPMLNDARQPSVQERLLMMLMQKFSQQ